MDQEKPIYKLALGAGFDIERNEQGDYHPAEWMLFKDGKRLKLHAEPRLLGFSDVVRSGLAEHLTLIGGDEIRYQAETPSVSRPVEIRNLLLNQYACDPTTISAHQSEPNTRGNVAMTDELLMNHDLSTDQVVWITSHVHVPRLQQLLNSNIAVISAEAIYLLAAPSEPDRQTRRAKLTGLLGSSELANQIVWECNGIADLLAGTYQPFTRISE